MSSLTVVMDDEDGRCLLDVIWYVIADMVQDQFHIVQPVQSSLASRLVLL